jgi:hypothetical protein
MEGRTSMVAEKYPIDVHRDWTPAYRRIQLIRAFYVFGTDDTWQQDRSTSKEPFSIRPV